MHYYPCNDLHLVPLIQEVKDTYILLHFHHYHHILYLYYINQKIKNNQKVLCPSCIKEINDENFRWTEKEINQKLFNKYKYQKFSFLYVS